MQEHISEYGVHWNFFFTLSATALASALLPLRGARAAAAAAALAAAHQAALSLTGLTAWLEPAERDMGSLVEANKEGLCSLPGYLALCYAGSAAASLLQPCQRTPVEGASSSKASPSVAASDTRAWFVRLTACTAMAWACTLFAAVLVQPVSRRFSNLAYVLWISAMCLSSLLLGAVAQMWVGVVAEDRSAGQVLTAISKHQLAVFLIANVLTGLVNLSIDTLNASNGQAAVVLSLYTVAWSTAPLGIEWLQGQRWSMRANAR
jgi:glucosaminylphosphatidylinositol acyltransferase